jgi:hypothetical protein
MPARSCLQAPDEVRLSRLLLLSASSLSASQVGQLMPAHTAESQLGKASAEGEGDKYKA